MHVQFAERAENASATLKDTIRSRRWGLPCDPRYNRPRLLAGASSLTHFLMGRDRPLCYDAFVVRG